MLNKLKVIKLKKLYLLILIASVAFSGMSCAKKSAAVETVAERDSKSFGYEVFSYTIEPYENCGTYLDGVYFIDNHYCICMHYLDESGLISSNLILTESDGENEEWHGIENNLIPCSAAGNTLLSPYSYNQIAMIDSSSGDIIKLVECGTLEPSADIIGFEDFFYVINGCEVSCYDLEGNLLYQVTDNEINHYNQRVGMFESGDSMFIPLSVDVHNIEFFSIDESGIEKVSESQNIGLEETCLSKNYSFLRDGEYIYNPQDETLTKLADFNLIDIIPESRGLMTPAYWIGIDEQHFSKIYNYTDESIEILLCNYEPSIDHSNAVTITIGGYGVTEDLAVKWMQYLYNKGNENFRIILEDYGERFPYYDALSAMSAKVDLIKYFEDGNRPDIYYGSFFDFNYMGRNGEVVDLLTINSELDLAELSPSVLDSTLSDGHLYRLFPSYYLNGFWGKTEYFPSSDISIYELDDLVKGTGIQPFSSFRSVDIADGAIEYAMEQFVYDPDRPLTYDMVIDTVEFALEYGYSEDDMMSGISAISDIRYDSLLGLGYIGNLYNLGWMIENEEISFIGYPSVYGASHLINPTGLVAISTDSANIDESWAAISLMFSDEIQKILVTNQSLPVNDAILRASCDYAIAPSSVPDDDYIFHSYYYGREPLDKQTVDSLLNAVNNIDTVVSYDWGIYSIIREEINSKENGKTIEEIADCIYNRINTYVDENY